MKYWYSCSHEQFTPSALLDQAVRAEEAGFDGVGCSDHFAPWWPGGESGHAWAWLGAAGQATSSVAIGTGVTPIVHRYHPAVVAQAFMTLEELFPGRVFLGTGSGEALNEIPCGADWPSVGEQIARLDSGLEAITRLWAGETVTLDGGWFRCQDAVLHTRAKARPMLYVSAFGPQAAAVAGRHGDGLWTLGDPDSVPEIIDAYKAACDDNDREPGEIILHSGIAWAESDDEAIEGARGWRGTVPDEVYADPIGSPEEIQDFSAPRVDDDALRESAIVSADPEVHLERVRALVDLGATVVCLQNMSGADPLGTIATYRDHVLPALRG